MDGEVNSHVQKDKRTARRKVTPSDENKKLEDMETRGSDESEYPAAKAQRGIGRKVDLLRSERCNLTVHV